MERVDETVDVQVFFTKGRTRPVRFQWHGREVRLNPPGKVDKVGLVWEYWCRDEKEANIYRLKFEPQKLAWTLVEIGWG